MQLSGMDILRRARACGQEPKSNAYESSVCCSSRRKRAHVAVHAQKQLPAASAASVLGSLLAGAVWASEATGRSTHKQHARYQTVAVVSEQHVGGRCAADTQKRHVPAGMHLHNTTAMIHTVACTALQTCQPPMYHLLLLMLSLCKLSHSR
jgi:hypothetical protein